ncbi:PAS domain S-box protein [Halopseudomonas sabulinigri]|uniref:histidine kinase n=1 Tax=Halopseudomonas sabulinigri TaxID=472181 RepID=A0ABP9ZSB7_9GAMM
MLTGSWFYNAELNPGPLLHGHHHHSLMVMSIIIAIAAAWLALQVAGLARKASTRSTRNGALLSGAAALGGGIWAMHFIGMLAHDIGMPVAYDPAITMLSILPALAASLVALTLLARRNLGRVELLLGGVLVGAGIGCMHYSGMLAMRMDAELRFDAAWFAASIVIAISLSMLSLWIRFGLPQESPRALLLAAVVMGLGISAMHYSGMAAARFIGVAPGDYQPQYSQHLTLGLIIALTALVLGGLVGVVNGIVRFSQLYQQLRARESKISAIVDTAIDGIITTNEQGIIQDFSRSAERMFGWRAAEIIGRSIRSLMPADTHGSHQRFLQDYVSGQKPQALDNITELQGLRRDGSTFPVRLALGQTKVNGANLLVGFSSDISERVALELELREREQQYSSLIANIPGVSFRCLPRGDWPMLFISEAAEALCGWPAEHFMADGRSFAELIHPDDEQRCYDLVMAAIARREKYSVEYRIRHRDGSERWVAESASGIFDDQGTPQWIDGVMIDVTDSKLRNAEFEGIVHAISRAQGMLELNLDARIVSVNESFLTLSGYPRSSLLGAHYTLLFEPADDDPGLWRRLRQGEYVAGEFSLRHYEGHGVHIQAYYNPILDADGKPRKVVVLATDLSERRRMEVDLLEAKERAEQAAESKGAFLANMSHEIRTPMNAIIGFSEVLLHDEQLPAAQQQHVKTVHNAARSLLGLLNDILDTAKLEKGAVQLENQAFSLFDLCQQLLDVFRLEASQKGLQLNFDYQLPQHHYSGDALRLRQVLTNLLGNAIKFTLEGQVDLQVSQSDAGICIQLRDTGIGIDPQRIRHIFEPFAQADASMSRRFGGTGLGTTIARQLVELMGGSISVTSEPGQGSCFSLLLPLAPAQAIGKARASSRISLPPLKILVADDVADNIRLMEVMLRSEGHSVTSAQNGMAAFEHITEERFDLVLMDMQMPEVNGLEASRIIRRYETNLGRPPTPIIALTASVLDKDRQAAKAAGMQGFASKPVDRQALQQEIRRVLGLDGRAAAKQETSGTANASSGPINWLDAEQRWGNRSALEQALRQFLQGNQHAAEQLAALLKEAQTEQAAALLHRLRGSAANLGLQRVERLAIDLEQRLAQPAANSLIPAVQVLHDALQAALASLPTDKATPRGSSLALNDAQRQQRSQLLSSLIAVLKRGEMNEQRLLQLDGLIAPERLELVQQALNDFDFVLAVQQLEAELSTPPNED